MAGSLRRFMCNRLDMILYERMPEMTKLVGAYIRNHPDEFVLVAD